MHKYVTYFYEISNFIGGEMSGAAGGITVDGEMSGSESLAAAKCPVANKS